MPVLSTRIVLDCFYLLILYSEKFSTDVCRLPYAVNVNLNLSIVLKAAKSLRRFSQLLMRFIFAVSSIQCLSFAFLFNYNVDSGLNNNMETYLKVR